MIAGLLSSMLPSVAGVSSAARALMPRNASEGITYQEAFLTGEGLEGYIDGLRSESGEQVTSLTALRFSPVWQCVDMISGDVASMTLNVYKRLDGDDREIDNKHPAQFLSSMRANEETDAWTFWRRLVAHALLWPGGFAWVERSPVTGNPVAFYNLLPDRTKAMRDDATGRLFYLTEIDGEPEVLFPNEVLHVKGLSINPDNALNLIHYARNAIGLGLAAEGLVSRFYKTGGQAGGILEIPASMSVKAAATLEEGFRKKYETKDSQFKSIVLREGAKFHAATIDAQRSQTHELRLDQMLAVAQFYKVPPSKLGLPGSVSYNSAEMAQLAYLQGCLNHWRMAVAGECNIKLLTETQLRNNTHYFEHNVSNIIELDFKTLTDTIIALRNAEIINANEGRRKLNLPKRKDSGGDEYLNPNTKSAMLAKGAGGASGGGGGGATDGTKPGDAPPNTDQKSAAAAGDVQASALNGAQIAGLLTIAQQLVADQLPKEGTRALITASFPLMTPSLISTIVEELDKFEPAELPAPAAPVQSQPPPDGPPDSPPAAVAHAMRALFADAIGRAARRVCAEVRFAAKKLTKFQGWIEDKGQEQRESFAEALRPALGAVAAVGGADATALLVVVEGRFFADILGRLSPLIEPPHSANDLAANVDAACIAFEAGIVEGLSPLVFPKELNP